MVDSKKREDAKNSLKHPGKHLISGGIAGAISRTLTHPLERLKILRQVSNVEYGDVNITKVFQLIYKKEGWKGFLKGNWTNVIRITPFQAVEFYSFEIYKYFFEINSGIHLLTCGAFAGITASTVTYPLDLIRGRLSVQTASVVKYNGITDAFFTIIKEEGYMALYKGWVITVAGIAPYVAFKMGSFQVLKNFYDPKKDDPKFIVKNMALGAAAGAIAATLTHPSDLVRRKLQLVGFDPDKNRQYRNLYHCCQDIWQREGVYGFYRGLIPNYLKVIPSCALAFMVNEWLKRYLNV